MKTEIEPPPAPPFVPRSIRITFETQKELDAFGGLFNCAAIGDVLRNLGASQAMDLYLDFEKLGANLDAVKPEIFHRLS